MSTIQYRDSQGVPFLHYCEVFHLPQLNQSIRVLKESIPKSREHSFVKALFINAPKYCWRKGTIVSGHPSLIGKNIYTIKYQVERLQ